MMGITESNLTAHELIGLRVTVSESSDVTKICLTGIVRNETRNTITVQNGKRFLCIPKNGSSFAFELPNGKMTVQGLSIQFRPEDRVKRGLAHW